MKSPPKRSAPGREIQGEASDVKRVSATVGHPVRLPNRQTSATAEGGSKKGCFYKPLPKQFLRDGYSYRQIARQGDAAIYEQTWTDCAEPSVCYEVIRIRRREGFEIGGRWVPPAEVYPNSEAWGVDGFTLSDRNAAFAKLREVGRK
jgi:hypothetical protein